MAPRRNPRFLTFYRDKRPFIVTSGLLFTIEPEKITSEHVALTLRLEKDSIFTPERQPTLPKGQEAAHHHQER